MSLRTLHFSLGPVQGFVAQARRTRDLWAGSFLLSWLTGQAMHAVRQGGGRIRFPDVDRDPLMLAIEGNTTVTPKVGSLPNRFAAEIPDGFDPKSCAEAVQTAWRRLGDAVWEHWLEGKVELGSETRNIWNRQIQSFWEISWVTGTIAEDGPDRFWLDRRKAWSNRFPVSEGGHHCMLMGDLQELSGEFDRGAQKYFWRRLREKTKEHVQDKNTLELIEDERLCAVALVKRLFPILGEETLKETIGWIPGGRREAIRNWPSTRYMAAVHWLEAVLGDPQARELAEAYAESVRCDSYVHYQAERAAEIACLNQSETPVRLDGNLFFRTALQNAKAMPIGDDIDGATRRLFIASLGAISKLDPIGGESSPYYALLIMDGDCVGALLEDIGPGAVSAALAKFVPQVTELVINRHNGVVIYAGGDDVLALLPLEDAVDCAMALSQAYAAAFDQRGTLSGALIFAEATVPLASVLKTAHDTLDKIAKDQNGRNSLAIQVLKPSGATIKWVQSWRAPGPAALITLVRQFSQDRQFSSRFFYNVTRRWAALLGDDSKLPPGLDPQALLEAEYLKNRDQEDTPRAQVATRVAQLLTVCRGYKSPKRGDPEPEGLDMAGALLMRFLAEQGRWEA
jgi:CRISPR-associated protein Cmr2